MSGGPLNDGGPAFPHYEPMRQIVWHGMTVRDYFAGQALPAVIAASPQGGWSGWAIDAYCMADAMLVLRGKDTRSDVRSLSLDAGLGLRGRASNILYCEGVDTVGQLCEMYETDLLRMRGFGEGTLDAVKAALAAHGLTLKGVARPTHPGEGTP